MRERADTRIWWYICGAQRPTLNDSQPLCSSVLYIKAPWPMSFRNLSRLYLPMSQ